MIPGWFVRHCSMTDVTLTEPGTRVVLVFCVSPHSIRSCLHDRLYSFLNTEMAVGSPNLFPFLPWHAANTHFPTSPAAREFCTERCGPSHSRSPSSPCRRRRSQKRAPPRDGRAPGWQKPGAREQPHWAPACARPDFCEGPFRGSR